MIVPDDKGVNLSRAAKSKQTSLQSSDHEVPGMRAESLRNHNLQLLAYRIVTGSEVMSRADLANETGLNRSTVTRLIERLIDFGIIKEGSTRIGPSGRPSIMLTPARRTHGSIGAEVGQDYICACVMDLRGNIIAEQFDQVDVPAYSPQSTLGKLAAMVNELTTQIQRSGLSLCGITCGFSGIISSSTSNLHMSPHLGWRNIDLEKNFRSKLNTQVPVDYQNTANLSALAESIVRQKTGQELSDFIFISQNSAIGSALVLDGKVSSGLHGWAGEIAHIAVSDEDRPCDCGAVGCLDAYIDKENLLDRAGLPANSPWEQLFASLHKGNSQATEAVRLCGIYLGRALSTYINLVDVTTIVLGGVLKKLLPYYEDALRDELTRRALCSKWMEINLQESIVKEGSSLQGAAWNSLLHFLSAPESWQCPTDIALSYFPVDETPTTFID